MASRGRKSSRRRGASLSLLLIAAAAALCIGLSIRAFGFTVVLVRGEAMADTLLPGDVVLLSRSVTPQAGHVVLASARNGAFFRRVAAQPGDRVETKGQVLLRNGMPLYEPYINGTAIGEIPATQLSPEQYLLLPDLRQLPGALAVRGSILGVAQAVIWPPRRAGFI